ncbi:MAG: hypothetical protein K2P63_01850 [Lachnospiraceae bacterium]|nr:hypothetical protein [Lachnospiraceae bacterium]
MQNSPVSFDGLFCMSSGYIIINRCSVHYSSIVRLAQEDLSYAIYRTI